MYYENFEKLLKEKGVRPSDVAKATGIKTSTLTSWKQDKYTPKNDKLSLIADYFGVSVEYLTTGIEKSLDEKYGDDMTHLYALIRNDAELSKALHKYITLTKEKKKHVLELINFL